MVAVRAVPEVILCPATRIYQWLFLDQQRCSDVDRSRQPEKQCKANNGNDPHRSQAKIESLCHACTYAEYPGALPIAVKSAKRSVVNVPGALTHCLFLHSGNSSSRILSNTCIRSSMRCDSIHTSSSICSSSRDISRVCFHLVIKCNTIKSGAGITINRINATVSSSCKPTAQPFATLLSSAATRFFRASSSSLTTSSTSRPANSCFRSFGNPRS